MNLSLYRYFLQKDAQAFRDAVVERLVMRPEATVSEVFRHGEWFAFVVED